MHAPRRSARLLAALLLAAAWALAAAQPAGAHAGLERSEPSSGSQLGEPPQRVLLAFDKPVDARRSSIRVLTAAGAAVAAGAPEVGAGGRTLTASLPELEPGAYVVSWQTASADGHPVQGALTFAVGAAAVRQPAPAPAPAPALDPAVLAAAAAAVLALLGGGAVLAFTRLSTR